MGGSGGLLVVMLVGGTQIEVGTGYTDSFWPGSDVRRDFDRINTQLSGANPFYVVLESGATQAFAQPAHLEALRELELWIEAQPEVGNVRSVADVLMWIRQALEDGDPAAFALPDTPSLAMQLYLFGGSDALERLIDARYRETTLVVASKVQESHKVAALVERIEDRLGELPAGIDAQVTGSSVLLNRTVDEIARGQLHGILAAVAIIYLVLAVMFTSARTGLVALFPNVLPIAIFFGTLGWAGIPLSPSTSLIACMALGIAVDDTIHYFARFNRDAKRQAREMPATRSALEAVIRPVTFTTAGLCAGFGALLASELASQAQFGLLAAGTLASAWLIDVTLTPALCSAVRIVTLWDVLRLDLGDEAHASIELFAGLGPRRARVVALMGAIERHPAGRELFREGETGHEIYVVIDGEVGLSFEREGLRVEFSKLGRGQVVGQSALSTGRRTATATLLADCRLLRFTEADLGRLAHRNPRIAAHVYRNLTHVQSHRIISLMDRLGDPDGDARAIGALASPGDMRAADSRRRLG